jgi:hypothetical protein
MKIKLLLIFLLVLLCGCSSPKVDIQKAATETLQAMPTNIFPYTPYPTYTIYPTYTPWIVTAIFTKGVPPKTPLPSISPTIKSNNPVYIVEEGFCIVSIGDVQGDPKNVAGCGVEKRYQTEIPIGGDFVITLENTGNREIYCVLFDLDGNFIVSDIDTAGSGTVRCKP